MPTPTAGESRSKFLSRCVPRVMGEGRKQNQAVAICYSLYSRQHDDAPDDTQQPPDGPPSG